MCLCLHGLSGLFYVLCTLIEELPCIIKALFCGLACVLGVIL